MAIKSVEKIIDGRKYTITTLTGSESVLCFQYLSKMVVPSLATLAGSVTGGAVEDIKNVLAKGEVKKGLFERDIPPAVFSIAAKEMMNRLDDKSIGWLYRFLGGTHNEQNRCVGEKVIFDSEFAGDIPLLAKVLFASLEVNYGSFFGENGVIGRLWKASGTLIDQAEKAAESPDGSNASMTG